MSTMHRTHDTGSRTYNASAAPSAMSGRGGGGGARPHHPQQQQQQQQSHSHHRSRNHSKSRSRSRTHSRSIHDSHSRSPTPKKRPSSTRQPHRSGGDRTSRKSRTTGSSRAYHSRRDRDKRQTRELPYPSRSRSTSRSKSRDRSVSRSRSRSASNSNDSDGKRRHRRHRRDDYSSSRHRRRDREHTSSRRRDGISRTKSDDARDSRHAHSGNGNGNVNGKHVGGSGSGSGGNTNGVGAGAGDKAPVSFKDFTNQMLEDDVTAQEAQKRYEKYLQRFSKSDDVLFFEAHKDEEWFQERYDPIIIEKSIDARRKNAQTFYRNFYEQFLADALPDVHDNVHDYKPMPGSALLSVTAAGLSSPLVIRNDDDAEQKQNTSRSIKSETQTQTETKNGGNANSTTTTEEGAVATTAKEDVKPEVTTTTTTTTIGGSIGGSSGGEEDDEQREGHHGGGDASHAETEGQSNVNSDNNGHASLYDADGSLRVPKYLDARFKDEYAPHVRESSPFTERPGSSGSNMSRTSDRSECYQNSVFIQGIPLHIPREKIETPFTKRTGFEKFILSDPIRNARKVRYGWVSFDSQLHCRAVLHAVSEGGLNGLSLTPQYHMNLLPKQKSKRRPKYTPPESLYPQRVFYDVKQCYKLAKKFDDEAGIVNNPLLREALLAQLSDIRKLNLLLLYLRQIHFLCYYCGKHFLSEEHMFARCSGTHERKVPHDISLAMSGSLDLVVVQEPSTTSTATTAAVEDAATTTAAAGADDGDGAGGTAKIVRKDKTSWEKELDQRISDLLNYVSEHKWGWMERKQIKMLEKNAKKISEGKYRCTVCSKLFKADVFVFKHIKNKHSDEIAKYIADQRLRTMFENYRRDRDRLTMRSFEDSEAQNLNNMHMGPRNYMHHYHPHMGPHSHMHEDRRQHLQQQHPALLHGLHGMQLNMGQTIHLGPILSGANHHIGNGMFPAAAAAANQLAMLQHSRAQAFAHPNAVAAAAVAAAAAAAQSQLYPVAAGTAGGGGLSGAARMDVDRTEERRARFNAPRADADGTSPDQYGRKIPIHYQESATRTRRSYKEVDVEFPDQESEEEIDYGFGDFVKNPTKFNL